MSRSRSKAARELLKARGVELEDDAGAGPVRVDLEPRNPDVRVGARQAVAVADLEEKLFKIALGDRTFSPAARSWRRGAAGSARRDHRGELGDPRVGATVIEKGTRRVH